MSKLWIRKWRILVMDKNDKEALNLSELHCTFSITKKKALENYATINIYNLKNETEQKIINDGDRLVIEAGYEGYATTETKNDKTGKTETTNTYNQYGVIFDGQIIYPTRHKENNTDFILTLLCIDGDRPLAQNFIRKTINKGLNQRQILNNIATGGNVTVPLGKVTDNLSEQKLPRGKVFFGEVKDYVADVARGNNAIYWVEAGNVQVQQVADIATGQAVVVSPQNGLIGTPQQTQFGLNFTLLMNPAVKMFTMVKIKNSEVIENQVQPRQQQSPLDDEWLYQVISVNHVGDTRGNDWYTKCESISRYGTGSLAALLANSGQMPTKS